MYQTQLKNGIYGAPLDFSETATALFVGICLDSSSIFLPDTRNMPDSRSKPLSLQSCVTVAETALASVMLKYINVNTADRTPLAVRFRFRK